MLTVIPYRGLLSLLASIFALRVAIQFSLQNSLTSSFLPPFDLWHSETMPYQALLLSQTTILVGMVVAIAAVPFKRPHPNFGATLITIGWIYTGVMAARMVVGALNLNSHMWFDGAIPTAFHFGLAAFVLVFGSAVRGAWQGGKLPAASPLLRFFAYPVLMVGGYALFGWLRGTGSPLLFSTYLSVLTAGFGILLHEAFAPAREAWRPNAREVLNDSLFLLLVQVALPTILKVLALSLILAIANTGLAPFASLWPHEAPVILQVAGMLLIAEFFRYWLHRALHEVPSLWQLHAVHHASNKLYTVNVGRFHPLGKSLQFLGDTAPFLLLGVSPEVFAVYFVLYAINGFYQHSNANVRLGPFNWLIAGPELHRWHHSVELSEAQTNYGNNLIIWDAVFGTRFLPKGKSVGRLGIGNPDWPNGFFSQMIAPFTTSTERPKS